MALETYREKRDFTRTPEPSGATPRPKDGATPLFFCVQKHLASQLHYDFRLEFEGVLLSWAVPKGPSLDPTVKRLAMHVEDHPIEYGEFEGVIPEGYGAGIVMLWDKGTWTPEVPNVAEALRKGDFKFRLDGYKLKGSWVLVRTRGYGRSARGGGDGRSWLLIKHRDEWSGPVDITEFAPLSVKSETDLEDILAADTPAVWDSGRPGGQIGAALAAIIERAARLRTKRPEAPADAPASALPEHPARGVKAGTRRRPPKAAQASGGQARARTAAARRPPGKTATAKTLQKVKASKKSRSRSGR